MVIAYYSHEITPVHHIMSTEATTFTQRLSAMSIIWKMTLVAAIGMSLAVTAATWISFNKSKELLLEGAVSHMQESFSRQHERLTYHIKQAQQEAISISRSDIIQGIIIAESGSGSALINNPGSLALKEHLERRFRTIIELKGYLQMRLIRLRDAKELVRVDAATGVGFPQLRRGNELQIKANSPYVLNSNRLKPGETYISSITLNREHGKIEDPWLPTQRFIAPVFMTHIIGEQPNNSPSEKEASITHNQDASPWGILVINTNAQQLMNSLEDTGMFQVVLTNSTGGILHHQDKSRVWGFEFGDVYGIQSEHASAWESIMRNKTPTVIWDKAHDEVHLTGRLPLSTRVDDHFIGLILTAKNKDILNNIQDLGTKTQLIAFLAIFCVGLATIYMVRRLTYPIKALTQQASQIAAGDSETKITIRGMDEVGKLGSTFADLVEQLQQRTVEAEQKANEVHQLNASLEEKVNLRTAELEEASAAANSANKAKSDFLATMSHEIRTPMNSVLGMTELLRDTRLDNDQQEYLDIIHQSGRALMDIINDILDFSKIEAGKFELESKPFDLERAVREAFRLMTHKAETQGIQLILQHSQICSRNLIGDAGRIRQVLLNLLSNAIKFTHEGQVTLNVTCADQNNLVNVHFSVTDTGIGITHDALEHLFDAFTQADTSTTRKYGGTGLGLAICKQIVDHMGGEIGADSVPGTGSTFWFHIQLPLIEPTGQSQHIAVDKSIQQQKKNESTTSEVTSPIDKTKLNAMRDLLGDDFGELILAFLESGESMINALPDAYAEQNSAEVERLTHSLKSAAANVGATHLSYIALNAENSVRRNGLNNSIKELITSLQSEYNRVCLALETEQK
ncbi:BarA sensory histidine kinase (= VarS = GacS) [hydrothermal vent metagenome]|uniref:histidine kinase n=1 Tax=hydrothermal vent metagenome TaxID=652676 RepID=A0A3B1AY48_9ZZZZ